MSRADATVVRLAKPLERAVADGHPWVFRDALQRSGTDPKPGTIVDLHDRRDRFLARGIADSGPIALRIWTMQREEIGTTVFRRRIRAALELRDQLAVPDTTALRWLHGEGDRVPGMVCDRYDSCLIVAWDGEGILAHAQALLGELTGLALARGITRILVKRGRGSDKQLTAHRGRVPTEPFEVSECGMKMLVDVARGQKTGLFLDHRDSRAKVRALAHGRRVLNLYGYTGGFSLAAGLGGALRVTTVDQSAPALELARASWLRCKLPPDRHEAVVADVRSALEAQLSSDEAPYDFVICDPPSFAPNRRSRDAALAAYRQLHRAAILRVADGGLLVAASCSAHVDRVAFDDTLRAGARAAKRHLQVLGRWGAAADHPVPLGFPEGAYLKVTLSRVTSR